MNIPTSSNLRNYHKDHCWQYDVKMQHLESDLRDISLPLDTLKSIPLNQYCFEISKTKEEFLRAKKFIEKYEWLGKLPTYVTHIFNTSVLDRLAGVIIYGTPYAESKKLFGHNEAQLEKCIVRGASTSWAHPHLASHSIKITSDWMAKNTKFRYYSAYSDPEAKELGTIYQACNFIYLGQENGAKHKYYCPKTGEFKTERSFRERSAYVRYAKELSIQWCPDWYTSKRKVNWGNVPDNIEASLKEHEKKVKQSYIKMKVPRKHKYLLVKGANKRETKFYKNLFFERNPNLAPGTHSDVGGLPYPKERGV